MVNPVTQLLKDKGLTAYELAAILETGASRITEFKNGAVARIPKGLLMKFEEAFGNSKEFQEQYLEWRREKADKALNRKI